MKLRADNPDIYIPDSVEIESALARTTHLAIGAHPDDLEIIGWHGISQCHEDPGQWFTGVVCCDGAGSPRSGDYAALSDAEMIATRAAEQRDAARIGKYSLQLQLAYGSKQVRKTETNLGHDLAQVIAATRPTHLYLHNLADAHATHVSVALACLQAVQTMDSDWQPELVCGVEVWRSLDWLAAPYRLELPLPDDDRLQQMLLAAHDSQVSGGKRYDVATRARQRANATFSNSHVVDQHPACSFAMDYRPFTRDHELTAQEYLRSCLDSFKAQLLQEPQ